MKKIPVIVSLVIVGFMGLGYLLYRISPQPAPALDLAFFDLGQAKKIEQPRAISDQDHILGRAEAKNVLIAYEDIQCPACKNFEPILKQLAVELTDTKLVFRHYPLYPLPHANSLAAAYAAEAAAAQGKFWEFTSVMFEKQGEWERMENPLEKMAEIASQVGVSNIEQFKNEIISSKNKEKIEADMLEAAGLGVNSTPTLLLNGKKLDLGSIDSIKKQAEGLYIK